MFFVQRILREAGFQSDIFCGNVDPRLVDVIKPLSEFEDSQGNLVVFHYSLGTPRDDWYSSLRGPRILVYHNITPHEHFPEGSRLNRLSQLGRSQLRRWGRESETRVFLGAIADSEFNAAELRREGFPSVAAIGLLVDIDRIRSHKWNVELQRQISELKTVLFVGNLIEHKGHLDLVRVFSVLAKISSLPVQLVMPGWTASPRCRAQVEAEITKLGLSGVVSLRGKCDNQDLYAFYRAADLYVSLSMHEGFGMPLVEAMAFDVPVLAANAGSVAATLNGGGVVLDERDPISMAAAARLMLEEPSLRTAIISEQRSALARYERPVLTKELETYLQSLGFEVHLAAARPSAPPPPLWRLEGPFDSSYSLAIVNRELARSLSEAGENVEIVSRDGPGYFAPSAHFLKQHPEINGMWLAAEENMTLPDVALRNQYPPAVVDMRGAVRVAANYAWEESGFPAGYVREFNSTLNLITVTSRFVAKVLRDNGVHVPIRVVGNGVDHMFKDIAWPRPREAERTFRFLHISSCFPRKGVDVLLTAWAKAFRSADDVELVIKTFPNPHNDMASMLKACLASNRDLAPVRLIDDEVGMPSLSELYTDADAVVCPSRGEGFNLVLAEAFAMGRSVVASAFGGHTDFCSPENAWLCDYSFAPARTHFAIPDSVWVEPDPESLAEALVACRSAPEDERRKRAQAGWNLISSVFTWKCVAARTKNAVAVVNNLSIDVLRLPKVGWITTWNSRCGIATYARSLTCAFESKRLAVFANRRGDLIAEDEPFVQRCWTQGWGDPLDELYEQIRVSDVNAVVIQFNLGVFQLDALSRLIERLDKDGILIFIILHATTDVKRPDITIRLSDARAALSRCSRLLVHSVHDLNRLKAIGLVENVTLFPHGVPAAFSGDRAQVRSSLGLSNSIVIASFGFLLPHKGLRELVSAFALLRHDIPRAHLMLINAVYPVPESTTELHELKELIARLNLTETITLLTDFLDEEDIISRLASADVIVYPYQQTQESVSGAVKLGLASLSPVACTPLPIFDDGTDVMHRVSGFTPSAIAKDLALFLSDTPGLLARRERQRDWVDIHAWPSLSQRLRDLIRGEVLDCKMPKGWRNFPQGELCQTHRRQVQEF